ncbi:S1 family peptidase [Cupriavidus taiwanensis]|uniref:S1 family peptidase n=1 Tax=Cupriavidus taiwanensis TaxID=164546 RepID=UPI0011C04BF1|nr:serine protease [Cupriavidus taiwanensis]
MLFRFPAISMRLRCLPAAIGLLCIVATPAIAVGAEPSLSTVSQSIFAVRTYGPQEAPLGAGLGVVIAPGQVVTACQVLAGARSIAVRRENVSYGASLEAPDVERGLCLLKVPNLGAPAAQIASGAAPGFGQKVFAASVAGTTVSLRQATVAGLQAAANGKLDRIEASVAPEDGATGGGLFDEAGRLVGILVGAPGPATARAQLRQAAVPASWVPEIRARGAAALAGYRPAAQPPALATALTSASAAAQPSAAVGVPVGAHAGSPRVGEEWRYQLTDNLTGTRQDVRYRVDRIENDRVIFNQGGRIELMDGRVDRIATPAGGEFDSAAPPGGWVPANVKVGNRWRVSYRQAGTGFETQLDGVATGESTVRVAAGAYRAIRITYDGHVQRPFYGFGTIGTGSVSYKAVVWYAPELSRVVLFTAEFTSRYERTNERLELAAHRLD